LDVVAGQVGAPEAGSAKPVLPKKQPFPMKKGWKNTAAVKTLLDPASSDFASGASLAAEGDDLPQSIKHDSNRGAPSDRSGSIAGEEPGSGAQSLAAAGLEPDVDMQDELGNFSEPNSRTFGNCTLMLLILQLPCLRLSQTCMKFLYNFLTRNSLERFFSGSFFPRLFHFKNIEVRGFSA
jgi:hypothetical protein